jgi:hypothetical protein
MGNGSVQRNRGLSARWRGIPGTVSAAIGAFFTPSTPLAQINPLQDPFPSACNPRHTWAKWLDFGPMERWLVLGTWALVFVTLVIAYGQHRALRNDLRVRLQLQFAERFDRLVNGRKALAECLLARATRDTISEEVMNFFEDLGMYLERGYLDEELVWKTFGFLAVRWWLACKDYVLLERRRHNDLEILRDFERLAAKMRGRDKRKQLGEPSAADVEKFLLDES